MKSIIDKRVNQLHARFASPVNDQKLFRFSVESLIISDGMLTHTNFFELKMIWIFFCSTKLLLLLYSIGWTLI